MADLYPTYGRQYSRQDMASYPQYQLAPSSSSSGTMQPPSLITSQPTIVDDDPSPTQHEAGSQSPSSPHSNSPKQESPTGSQPSNTQQPPAKPQATFLTKLYALLERPENHHMIRWDPAGEHIIVERPEQLALHVLPSVYRQSRFASFSRQLNIYGFMRKVNLRNVDPAIDDPDASTWSHPTLNRHSPPEVVANFKRRVPPRLPKKKPRDVDLPSMGPRTAVGVPPNMPFGSSASPPRARGLSAPGSFTPLTQPSAPGWSTAGYPQQGRTALPPLTVPAEPHVPLGHNGFGQLPYPGNGPTSAVRDSSMLPSSGSGFSTSSSGYGYQDQNGWSSYSSSASTQHTTGSLSSLLNPSATGGSSNYISRPGPPAITTYPSYPSLSSMSTRPHTAGGVSPDSRPTTGYSVSSAVSAMSTPYDDNHFDYSRPGSSHRPITPSSSRPTSKAGYGTAATLSIRRDRRHSHAVSPYPSPYDAHPPPSGGSDRPSTSPHPHAGDEYSNVSGLPRVRSMVGFGMGNETYSYNPAHGDFAYGAGDDHTTTTAHYSDYPEQQPNTAYSDHPQTSHSSYSLPMSSHGYANRNLRPATSTSSLSSNSAANTPGGEGFHPGVDQAAINRYES